MGLHICSVTWKQSRAKNDLPLTWYYAVTETETRIEFSTLSEFIFLTISCANSYKTLWKKISSSNGEWWLLGTGLDHIINNGMYVSFAMNFICLAVFSRLTWLHITFVKSDMESCNTGTLIYHVQHHNYSNPRRNEVIWIVLETANRISNPFVFLAQPKDF